MHANVRMAVTTWANDSMNAINSIWPAIAAVVLTAIGFIAVDCWFIAIFEKAAYSKSLSRVLALIPVMFVLLVVAPFGTIAKLTFWLLKEPDARRDLIVVGVLLWAVPMLSFGMWRRWLFYRRTGH
jgi:hypothetical protein